MKSIIYVLGGKSLRKVDHSKISFSDEKYFSIEGVFNLENEHVHFASRLEAERQRRYKVKV